MLCGAGAAGADTGADAGPGERAARSASASADKPARTARSVSARPAAAEARGSEAPSALASPAELPTPPSRVSAARVVRTSDNEPPAASALPAAAVQAAAVNKAAAAPVPVVPSSVPVDPAQYAGTYYEQGSVKQFFNFGLVNTRAVYTLRPDGTLGVQNSGNYFFKRGPRVSLTGSAVPVNPINTALNVGFGGTPSANPPGNYLIVDRAPDYSWVIVTDPSGRSGFILTRSQTIDPRTYQELVTKARALGVQGRITPTRQFP
jgi:lipocalin